MVRFSMEVVFSLWNQSRKINFKAANALIMSINIRALAASYPKTPTEEHTYPLPF